jgi:hypothetical protein
MPFVRGIVLACVLIVVSCTRSRVDNGGAATDPKPETKPDIPASAPAENSDRAIIETVARHILTQREFYWRRSEFRDDSKVALDRASPGESGMIARHQIEFELHDEPDHKIAEPLFSDLIERNRRPFAWNELESTDAPIVLLNLADYSERRASSEKPSLFEQRRDLAVWIHAWRPGYSRDQRQAVLRFWIGPSPHDSVGTYFLEKRDGRWSVVWWELSYFF